MNRSPEVLGAEFPFSCKSNVSWEISREVLLFRFETTVDAELGNWCAAILEDLNPTLTRDDNEDEVPLDTSLLVGASFTLDFRLLVFKSLLESSLLERLGERLLELNEEFEAIVFNAFLPREEVE